MNHNFKDEMQLLKKDYEERQMSSQQLQKLRETMRETVREQNKKHKKNIFVNISVAAASLLALFFLLPNMSADVAYAMGQIPILGSVVRAVTFRNYSYEADRNFADVSVPKLEIEQQIEDALANAELECTVEEINKEIEEITNQMVNDFKQYLTDEVAYQEIIVKSEVLATTPKYFTIKLICYQGAGSGSEWDYFYTVDLQSGKRIELKDLFYPNSDYKTPIRENIKKQMREQMAQDETVQYFLEDEYEYLDFEMITDETSFYLNRNGNIVIAFDEYEVAPGSMGCVEFEIPNEVIEQIRILE